MFFGRPWSDWIAQYSSSHRNAVNRVCHTIGIPLIVVSLTLLLAVPFMAGFWRIPVALFVLGGECFHHRNAVVRKKAVRLKLVEQGSAGAAHALHEFTDGFPRCGGQFRSPPTTNA